jgi:RNA polymerase sigma-54 factor
MEPTIRMRPSGAPVPRPKVSPKTIVVSGLLELASAELEQVILQELAENPALRVAEADRCERCGATLSGSVCPDCRSEPRQSAAEEWTPDWGGSTGARWAQDEDWDPLSQVAAPWSITDHLLWQFSPQLQASELEIASLLLENLDHRGLLDCEVESVASSLDVPLSQVEKVLAVIQRQDPAGIGAKTVRESLLIQLECLQCEEDMAELSTRLIEDHWEALCKGKVDKIAKELELDVEEVGLARDFIKQNLDPYPVHACVETPFSANEPVDAQYIRPDVIISVGGSDDEQEFTIHFPEESHYRLGLDNTYKALLDSLNDAGTEARSEGYEHLRQFVSRSKVFISGWQERWQTLRRVVEVLVEHQRGFLLGDATCLRPLTRTQLADMIGMHESTISRAVAGKYAQIPGGRIVALADFFDGSLKAKALIEEWVSGESHPLTDGELVELLSQAGISIARRTVAKYRQAAGILPSELR